MPANSTIPLEPRVWTRVTSNVVTALRLQNCGSSLLLAQAGAASPAPVNGSGSISLRPGEIILPDVTLADLWPGVSGAGHVWVWSGSAGEVSVSHV